MKVTTKRAVDLRPGKALPVSEKTFSSADLIMYGAATWDWHRLHHDDAFAREMGLPAPVIDGQVHGALFAKQAIAWLGPKAFVRRLNLRMRKMAFAGESLRIEGRVSEVCHGGDRNTIVLQQQLMNGDDIVAEATTEVQLPE